MMFENLPDIELFKIGNTPVSVLSIVGVTLVLLFTFFSIYFSSRLVKRFSKRNLLSRFFARYIQTGLIGLILICSLVFILEIFGVQYHSFLKYELWEVSNEFTVHVYNILVLLVIVYLIRLLVYLVENIIDKRIAANKLDKGRGRSFFQIVKYVVWMIGIIIVISSLGVKVTLIIASISALLIGVGFGLQHIFNDLFSGIIILFDGSVEVDDVVEVDGTVGRVLEIGLRVSKLLTRDNVVIIIPNSRFTGERVINWSHNEDVTRFHVNVGVAYGSDVRLVEKILLECASRHQMIVKTPKPFVRFNDFGESSLDFQLYFWTANDFLVENIKSDLRFDIDDQFRKNKVEIPFPQRDLHLKSKHFEG